MGSGGKARPHQDAPQLWKRRVSFQRLVGKPHQPIVFCGRANWYLKSHSSWCSLSICRHSAPPVDAAGGPTPRRNTRTTRGLGGVIRRGGGPAEESIPEAARPRSGEKGAFGRQWTGPK